MDFGFIKELMIKVIHGPVDHGMIWYVDDPMYKMFLDQWDRDRSTAQGWKIYIIDCVPTAENLAKVWFEELTVAIETRFAGEFIEDQPTLMRVYVHETPNCVAWYPSHEETHPKMRSPTIRDE